ncbi:MAG: alpha/beta hydrolase [Desulfobacterales bacterium]
MPYFTTPDGCRLFFEPFETETPKPALVFLNGTTQTTVHWQSQALYFINDFRSLRYDARAQGKSDIGKAPLSLDLHLDDLTGLLIHAGIEKATLVGLSHGANVALAMAAAHPARIERLILCSVAAEPGTRARTTLRSWEEILKTGGLAAMAWAALPVVFGEAYLDQNRRILDMLVTAVAKRNRADRLLAHLEAMARYPSPASYAARIRQPTLVVSGDQDPLVSAAGAARLAALCRGLHYRLPRAGHTVPLEEPALFNQALEEFFSSARRP